MFSDGIVMDLQGIVMIYNFYYPIVCTSISVRKLLCGEEQWCNEVCSSVYQVLKDKSPFL